MAELKASDGRPSGGGSDDIAEVSWNLPTVVLRYPGNIPGMIGHHWSSGIAMATPIAHKGASRGSQGPRHDCARPAAAPRVARSGAAILHRADQGTQWKSLIPEGTKPPIDLNKEKMERFHPLLRKLRYDPAKYGTYMEQLGIKYPTLK